jgi:hypothetical protein
MTSPWRTIVGIVGDVRHSGPDNEPAPEVFLPLTQDGAARHVQHGSALRQPQFRADAGVPL